MKEKETEYEPTECEYVQQLMDDFGLDKSNTLGELLMCLQEEDNEESDGNI